MELFGSEATEASRGSLRAAIYSCLLVLAGGSYWLSGPAGASDASHTLRRDATDLQTIQVLGIRPGGGGWGGGGGGGGGWGGDASASLNWGDYVSYIPDTDTAHRAADKGDACPIGNPVIAATGNKIESEVDFKTANDDGLSLEREYNHYWDGTGVFGGHWITNHDYSLVYSDYDPGACTYDSWGLETCDQTKANTITARRPDARRLRYSKAADGRFYSADLPSGTYMEFDAEGRVVYHAENQQLEFYGDPFGASWIISRISATGQTWKYDYIIPSMLSRVTYNSGRYIEFIRDSNYQVTSVRDPAGNFHAYTYRNVSGKPVILTSHAQASTGTSVTYHYEDTADTIALTGKSFNGVRYSTFRYDPTRRVSSEEHAGGVDKYAFHYGVENDTYCNEEGCYSTGDGTTKTTTTVTNPLGLVTTYRYTDGREVKMEGSASVHCPATSVSKTYDAEGRLDKTTDARGVVTDIDYDSRSRRAKVTQAVGSAVERTSTYTWDTGIDRLLSVTIQQGGAAAKRVDYAYTPDNRLASVVETNLKNVGVQGQTRVTTYTYTNHPNGLLATVVVDGPVAGTGDVVTYTYSAAGDLLEVKNSLGHKVTYSGHNGLGLPGRVVGTRGEVTDYAYDALGRTISVKPIVGGVARPTNYVYAPSGLLTSVSMPDGQTRSMEYDAARRLTREYEHGPNGIVDAKRYSYNAASKVTSIVTERTANPPPTIPVLSVPAVGAEGIYSISWSAVSASETYKVTESFNGGATKTVYDGPALSTAFSAKPQGNYAYAVAACNSDGGCTAFSAPATVKSVYKPTTAPTPSAPAQSTAGSYTVSWSALVGVTSYKLEESTNGGTWTQIQNTAATSKAVTGNTAGTYSYRVTACNEAGCGPVSGVVSVLEIDPPTNIPVLSAPAVNSTGSYSVTWNGVANTTYYLLDESSGGGTWALASNTAGTSSSFTGKNTGIAYQYRIRACNTAGCGAYSGIVTVDRIIYNAQFISQSVSGVMAAGKTYRVTVQMQNTGNMAWSESTAYRLGSQNPRNNTIWGTGGRVAVPGSVSPGGTATFSFDVVAPATAGNYNFQWQMVRDGYTWFGPTTNNVVVNVASGSIGANPNPCGLYIGETTCTTRITWSSSRSDAEVWVSNLDGSGPQLFARAQSGGQYATWITTAGTRFSLKAAGVTLAAVDVAAYNTNEYRPEPEEPTCPTCQVR